MTATDTQPEIQNYGGRHPYSGLLRNISPGADVTQALAEADLLYGVEKVPLTGSHPLDVIPVTDRMLTVRIDDPVTVPTALAVVGHDYQVISNLDAFAPLDVLREAGRITFDQGGRTRDGKHAFLLCKLTDGHTIPGGDPHDRYILARTSHDGTGALRLIPVAQRYWCCNQMPAILATRGAVISIHHGRKAAERMEALPAMLDLLVTNLDAFDAEWAALAGRPVTPAQVRQYADRLFPMPTGPDVTDRMRATVADRRNQVVNLALGSESTFTIRRTRASLISAATEWDQWLRTKDTRRSGLRALEGTNLEFTRRAWDLAHV